MTVSTNQQERADLTFPKIWTVEIWEDKKKSYSWLSCESRKLGCTIRSSVVKLGAFKTQGVSLSKEWCSHSVTTHGKTRTAMLSCLRKKCFKHLKSQPHQVATEIEKSAKEGSLETIVICANESEVLATTK